jgi:hypothetical protein
MITLPYGRKKPQNGNKGLSVFDALAANIDIDDAHSHNGVNSGKIKSMNLERGTVSILNTAFTLDPDGYYYGSVALPAGHSCQTSTLIFLCVGGDFGGVQCNPSWAQDGDEFHIEIRLPFPQTLNLVCV